MCKCCRAAFVSASRRVWECASGLVESLPVLCLITVAPPSVSLSVVCCAELTLFCAVYPQGDCMYTCECL